MPKSKSPLRYAGGKSNAVDLIRAMLPKHHESYKYGRYVEPFFGGGSVFFGVSDLFPCQRTILSDKNESLMHFWKALWLESFYLHLAITDLKASFGDGRSLYEFVRHDANGVIEWLKSNNYEAHMSPDTFLSFPHAMRFYILNRITFSGLGESGGYSQASYDTRFKPSNIDTLQYFTFGKREVSLLYSDYRDVDYRHNDFVFFDPPYLGATKSKLYGKKGDLHDSFSHEEFATFLSSVPFDFLMTVDDCPETRELYGNFNIVPFGLQYSMNHDKGTGKAKIGKEIFVLNYNLNLP